MQLDTNNKEVKEIELLLLMVEETLAQINDRLGHLNTNCQERERLLITLSASAGRYNPGQARLR